MMHEEGKQVSIAKLCRWFDVPRSTFYYEPRNPKPPVIDVRLATEIRKIIDENPAYGLRRIVAVLRNQLGFRANRKRVHRIIKLNSWQVRCKPKGNRPRAQGWVSRTEEPDTRWAIDTTHVFCGRDGWCHLTAIIDCCDRKIVGWRFSQSGIAKVAAAALEDAVRARGITPDENTLTLRSDNGLVFGAKAFVKVAKQYRLEQEYITPYTPEQNGMIERWFRSLKEECVWLHRFKNRDEAFVAIANWVDHYHGKRPHSALGYLTPIQFQERLAA
jgi:putative transposase